MQLFEHLLVLLPNICVLLAHLLIVSDAVHGLEHRLIPPEVVRPIGELTFSVLKPSIGWIIEGIGFGVEVLEKGRGLKVRGTS
jgi:hypothetical protein